MPAPDCIKTLSELNSEVAGLIKDRFKDEDCWVTAEIQKVVENSFSGHCYLDLVEKDGGGERTIALARATIWKFKYEVIKPYFEEYARMPLSAGIKVLLKVKPVFNEVYGYSLNVSDIEPAYTLGAAALERERTIRRLKSGQVFDQNKELPFPGLIRRIALVTSSTAAGREDFLNQLDAGHYKFHVEEFPATMQGNEAVASIIAALDAVASDAGSFDVVVIVRGGGAVADLQCFDAYRLAYFCTQFPLPIVTGIGHHRDVSVVDMVAALSLKTPTAVAQFIVDKADIATNAVRDAMQTLRLATLSLVQQASDKFMPLCDKLGYAAGFELHKAGMRASMLQDALSPALLGAVQKAADRLAVLRKETDLCDPRTILARGYCIAAMDGKTVTAADLSVGDNVELEFSDGLRTATVRGPIL